MEYITLILVAGMWAYFIYVCNLLFRGILNNCDKNYKEYLIKMIVVALAVYIIKPSVFLKPLLVVGTIISYERIVIVIALVVLAIKYIRRRR